MVYAVDFAELLRSLMAEREISGRQLAARVPCDPSLVCRYRSGKQRPTAKMAKLFDAALEAGGKLIGAARTEAGPDRRSVLAGGLLAGGMLSIGTDVADRLDWSARHPARIDMAAVDSLADVLAGQRHAEDAFGSAAMLGPVMAQLAVVDDLVTAVRGPLRPAGVDIAQQWTH